MSFQGSKVRIAMIKSLLDLVVDFGVFDPRKK